MTYERAELRAQRWKIKVFHTLVCIGDGKIQDVTVLYDSIIDIHLGWLQYVQVSWKTTHRKEKKDKSRGCAVQFPLKFKLKPVLLLCHRKYLLGRVHNERMEWLEYLRNIAFYITKGQEASTTHSYARFCHAQEYYTILLKTFSRNCYKL